MISSCTFFSKIVRLTVFIPNLHCMHRTEQSSLIKLMQRNAKTVPSSATGGSKGRGRRSQDYGCGRHLTQNLLIFWILIVFFCYFLFVWLLSFLETGI